MRVDCDAGCSSAPRSSCCGSASTVAPAAEQPRQQPLLQFCCSCRARAAQLDRSPAADTW
eukprot:10393521-Alexandrium_andersonii.AAC.1